MRMQILYTVGRGDLMGEISKVQVKILEDLYRRDVDNALTVRIQPSEYDLDEKDEIMRIRELVYYIDRLKAIELVDTQEHYYTESDSVSIEYLNNAIEINDRRINLSPLGIEYIEVMKKTSFNRFYDRAKKSFNETFTDHPYRVAITHIVAFGLGVLSMWGITRLF